MSAGALAAPGSVHAALSGADGLIAYVSNRDGNLDIWTMNADGSGLALLTPGPETTGLGQSGSEPSWSPDGARIAYVSGGDVWVMNADGSVKAPLTATTGATSVEKYPDWSPDGTRLIYERTGQIWRMRADGTQQKAVTSGFAECGTRPAWSSVGNLDRVRLAVLRRAQRPGHLHRRPGRQPCPARRHDVAQPGPRPGLAAGADGGAAGHVPHPARVGERHPGVDPR